MLLKKSKGKDRKLVLELVKSFSARLRLIMILRFMYENASRGLHLSGDKGKSSIDAKKFI